ncbi:MAG TPA: prephenate dehydrogenase/arogenate dehydrogenase family protein [Candidatus Saccharibacteria bacterium]|jgi:prephenate dehydrogenase|nr:prephenate dehydrogenase/arogenate dehydrogenase family protein [Candidatus Saccharibacteria bacterium]
MTITIFGTGSFGKLIAKLCPQQTKVNLLSLRALSDAELKDTLERTDILFLTIPLSAYQKSLARIKTFLKEETLLVDVCSVKLAPSAKIKELLPEHKNLLITHPLFGPQSSKNGTRTEGLSLVLCHKQGELADRVISYSKSILKLKIVEMDAREHDRQMANAQALTFFVSEVLSKFKFNDQILKTPSFEELLDLRGLAEKESTDLLRLIQNDNPFAQELRNKFITEALKINKKYTS